MVARTHTSAAVRWLDKLLPVIARDARPFKPAKNELNFKKSKLIGSVGHVDFKVAGLAYRYDDAALDGLRSLSSRLYAAKYCAQLRGATAAGHPDCSFSTLDKCRLRVRHRGGGHCYRSH